MTDDASAPAPCRDGDSYEATLRDAWLATRMERDRSILTLSAGGIGLLVALMTARRPESSGQMVIYLFASIAFVTALIAGLMIFKRNATYLEAELAAWRAGKTDLGDAGLVQLDWTLLVAFVVGVVLTILVAIMSAWPSTKHGCHSMTERDRGSIPHTEKKSYSGVGKLRPQQQSNNPGSNREL
jgi:hypothetical protein